MTVTEADVVVLPAASRATAVRVWEPSLVAVVSQVYEYGLVVSSVPMAAPSSWNWTLATSTSSEAEAVTLTVPDTVAPAAGDVRLADGGVVSRGGAALREIMALPMVALRFQRLVSTSSGNVGATVLV